MWSYNEVVNTKSRITNVEFTVEIKFNQGTYSNRDEMPIALVREDRNQGEIFWAKQYGPVYLFRYSAIDPGLYLFRKFIEQPGQPLNDGG